MTEEAKRRIKHCLETKETTLKLSHSGITDYVFLAELTHLTQLHLSNNDTDDLRPLSKLTNLTALYLSSNGIVDIRPLAKLTNLTVLSLSYNSIEDLKPLANLSRLTSLNLRSNKISNIAPLAQLTDLENIDLSRNSLSQLSDWSMLKKLNSLNLAINNLTDVTFLSPLKGLTELNLNTNKISDLSPLAKLTYLKGLNLSDNKISDVTPLSTLTHLAELNLMSNQITDIRPLMSVSTNKMRFSYSKAHLFNRIAMYNNPLAPALIAVLRQSPKALYDYFNMPFIERKRNEATSKIAKEKTDKETAQKQFSAIMANLNEADYKDLLERTQELLDKANVLRKQSGLKVFSYRERQSLIQKILGEVLGGVSFEAMSQTVEIIDYTPQYKDDFKRLNVEWISTFFALEAPDLAMLNDPEGYILSKGGKIFFAKLGDAIIGTCALLKISETNYELVKMGVSPQYQGLGAGKKLGQKVIEETKRLGGTYLFLESNQKLIPALTMYKSLGFVEVPMGETPYTRADFKGEMYL